ncbi:MAG: hypothetical protein CMN94_07445 [Synechococcus sp. EAC657]|nr:hypothetical protein [Synechococcus sp. EAC657]|tara:strand:+ start:1901 stop:3343 length:1443 start_codon:yes stop_codon:yes gene_type:complete
MDNKLQNKVPRKISTTAVLNSPNVIAGGIFIGLAGITAVWGFTAPIPVQVNGLGVLAPVDGLFTYQSQSAGRILLPFTQNKQTKEVEYVIPSWSQRAYAFNTNSKTTTFEESVVLTEQILDYLNQLRTSRMPTSLFSGGLETGGNYTVKMNEGDIVAIIDQPSARQELRNNLLSLKRSISNYQNLIKINQESLALSKKVEESQNALIQPLGPLVKEGFVSQLELNQALAETTQSRIAVSDLSSNLQRLELEIKNNQSNLIDSLSQFLRDSVVFAFDDAYVQSFTSSQWDFVQPGSEIMTVSWSNVSEPSVIPVFIDQRAATQVDIGQEVILTPLGFSSAEIGGIKGQIDSLESIPFTTATLASRLNSQGLATVVSPQGSVYQVNVRLKTRDLTKLRKEASTTASVPILDGETNSIVRDNTGRYVWNNRSNPPISPREGFLLSTQITTRVSTPIQMLIPALREMIGIAPPDKLIRLELNQP